MPRIYHTASPIAGSPHVFIATPAASLHGNYVASLAASLPRLMAAGIAADYCLQTGNCHVDDARNAMLREFLKTTCEALIFIDADVGWDADDLIRLCRYERDMVAGIYPLKEDEEGYPVQMAPGREIWSDADGLVEAEGVPTGFLRISRAAVERMVAAYGERRFWGRGQARSEPPHVILFERTYEGNIRYSGDYAFCRKWQRLGGKMYVDPTMAFSHAGEREWHGQVGHFWKRSYGVLDAEIDAAFAAAVETLRSGRATPEALAALVAGWRNPDWQATPGFLLACWEMARQASGQVLECGSGLSTLVLALANPGVEVHALEHDPIWASRTRDALLRHGIGNATVHLRHLIGPGPKRWYNAEGFETRPWSLVVVDGPPRQLADRGEVFRHVPSAATATLLFDDADDPAMAAACEAAGLRFTPVAGAGIAVARPQAAEAA